MHNGSCFTSLAAALLVKLRICMYDENRENLWQIMGNSACLMMKLWGLKGRFKSFLKIFIFYYPPEVSSMKYCCFGLFRKEYYRLITN